MTVLYLILIVVAIIIFGGFAYLSFLPANYKVSRSRVMNVPTKKVFDKVLDFRTWPTWSPWLMHDPKAKIKYGRNTKEVGGYQNWSSKAVGEGKLTHVRIEALKHIEQKIEFIKPFRSVSKVEWTFNNKSNKGTKVTWSMQGRMPFFLRFMTNKMDGMLGLDYEMGLLMLNRLLDPKSDKFELKFVGKEQKAEIIAAYEACDCSMPELSRTMEKAFGNVTKLLKEKRIKITEPAFSAYHKVNRSMTRFIYDCAIPVAKAVGVTTYTKKYPGGTYFKVRYHGNYDYLKHVWYAAMGHIRMKKHKYDSSRPSLEIYTKDRQQVKSPNDCITDIYVPVK